MHSIENNHKRRSDTQNAYCNKMGKRFQSKKKLRVDISYEFDTKNQKRPSQQSGNCIGRGFETI